MADSVVAAVTTVITLLDKVLQFDKNRSDSANIDDVKCLFSTLIAYLNDTEGIEATEGLKDRVDQVRAIANETHDAIREFMYHVPGHCHSHWFTRTCHDVAHFFKDLVPAHQFSSRMKAINRKLKAIQESDSFRVGSSGAISSSSAGKVPSCTYSFSGNDHLLVGIEEKKKALLSLVLSEESRDIVISVIGDAGSGKTTLIREVYQMIKESFNCQAWVFGEGLLDNLCEELKLRIEPAKTRVKRLRSYLQSKSYLLVFDSIWTEDELDCIKYIVPDNNLGGRILISTRNRNLASYRARSSDCFYDLKLLTEFGSSQLFCSKTFGDTGCPDFLVDWSEKIVKRSEGSPHVIVAVSNFLSKRPHTLKEFMSVHDSLKYEPGDHVGHSCYSILSTSYVRLSSILKYCFLSFCFFPEDYSIPSEELVWLWIVNGEIEQKRGKTLEQVGYEYLEELVQMSLVQVLTWDFDGHVESCRVSNLARGFIISKSEKDWLFAVLRPPYTSLDDGKTHHLSLQNCSLSILQKKDFSNVCTLFVFEAGDSSEAIPKNLFSNFKYLSALYLENVALPHFPEMVFELTLLRHLCLRKTRIKSVPKSIKNLWNLRVFKLEESLVTNLPSEIIQLRSLLCLSVSCQGINDVAVGVEVFLRSGFFTSLQILSLIKANYKNKSIVKELGNLTNLTKLRITELKKEDGKDFCASIEMMEHLSSLDVSLASNEEYLDLGYVMKLPKLLKNLYLGGRLEEIPAWICKLKSLSKLILKGSKLQTNSLEALQVLPSLKVLHLHDAFNGQVLKFSAKSFLELRVLEIENCSQLDMVVIPGRAMPKLQKLIVKNCGLARVHITKKMHSQLEEVLVPPELLCFPVAIN